MKNLILILLALGLASSCSLASAQCWNEKARKEAEFQGTRIGQARGREATNKKATEILKKEMQILKANKLLVERTYLVQQALRQTEQNLLSGIDQLQRGLAANGSLAKTLATNAESLEQMLERIDEIDFAYEERLIVANVLDAALSISKEDFKLVGNIPARLQAAFTSPIATEMSVALEALAELLITGQEHLASFTPGQEKSIAELTAQLAAKEMQMQKLQTEKEAIDKEIRDRTPVYERAVRETPVFCSREPRVV